MLHYDTTLLYTSLHQVAFSRDDGLQKQPCIKSQKIRLLPGSSANMLSAVRLQYVLQKTTWKRPVPQLPLSKLPSRVNLLNHNQACRSIH